MNLKRRAKYAYLFILPFFLVFLVFSVYPIFYSLYISFNKMDALSGNLSFVGLDNYVRLFKSEFFYNSILNTLIMWIMSIIPQLTIAFLLALFMQNKWFRGRSILRNVYYFPNLVTSVTIGLLFGSMFSYPGGAINNVISALGLEAVDFKNNQLLAQMVIAIAICWKNFGYNIIFFTAGLNTVPKEVYESAEVDGANAWHKVTIITMPLIKPILLYVFITSVIGGLQMFDESKLVFTHVPGDATTTMVKYLYDSSFERLQFGYGAAASYGIFFIITVFSVIAFYVTKDKTDEYGRTNKRRRVRR